VAEDSLSLPGPTNGDAATLFADQACAIDAVLVVSFGGPEGPDDVLPFLENVFRGLRVTEATKQRIAARYHDFDGVSPINGQTRRFIAALEAVLELEGPRLPIYWGNRNWQPMLRDTLGQMAADGIQRAAVYVTSTFSSYSGCRKYREDLFEAAAGLAARPALAKLRVGFNHPGFVAASADRLAEALARLPAGQRDHARVLFTAHSLPRSMAAACPYVEQLTDCAGAIASELGFGPDRYGLVFQSNNARYGGEPWLGPDIGDALVNEAAAGVSDVVVAPIGFVCDHMEVVLDLDVDAAARAGEAGINMVRAGTVGTHPAYVGMVRELIVERMTALPERRTVGPLGPKHDYCPADCCLSGRPGPAKPALGGSRQLLVPATPK
jgi:ferrochelatase